jgi:hypothetical protein
VIRPGVLAHGRPGFAEIGDQSAATARMQCSERTRLWDKYHASLELLTRLTEELHPESSAAMLAGLIVAVKAAGNETREARAAWEAHLTEHKCDG